MTDRDVSPWLIWGIYLFGIAFILTAAIDLFSTAWPMRPSEMQWRYGFLGLGGGYLQMPTLGLLLIAGGAILSRNGMLLRVVGIACLLLALSLLIGLGVFGLDVLQVRQIRPEEARTSVLVGGFLQGVKYFVTTIVLVLLGQGSLKTAKASSSDWAKKAPGIVSAATATPAPRRSGSAPATQAAPASPEPEPADAEAAPDEESDDQSKGGMP
jgi:hypothetical protein